MKQRCPACSSQTGFILTPTDYGYRYACLACGHEEED